MNLITRRLPSKLENVTPFIREVLEKMKSLPLPEEEIFPIKLSLEEALTNAMRHGNKLNPDLSVDVDLDFDDDRIVVKVKDQGDGFDMAHVGDPTRGENAQKPGGRGVFLIKRLMSHVEYFDGGRGIKMVKRIGKKI
jgi:serine/threonine-protein kinase RsbW